MKTDPRKRSPSGCVLWPDDKVHSMDTYRIVLVNDREFNRQPGKAYRTVSGALRAIADSELGAGWRVLLVPAGEPWDYDGRIVASVDTRSGQ